MKSTLKRTQEAHLRSVMGQDSTPPNVNLNAKRGGGSGFKYSVPKNWKRAFGGLAVPEITRETRVRCSGPNRVAR